jgi:hypothetical protein
MSRLSGSGYGCRRGPRSEARLCLHRAVSVRLTGSCQKGLNEPIFAFITDSRFPSAAIKDQIKMAVDYTGNLLQRMNMEFELGSEKRAATAFKIHDIQAVPQGNGIVRVFAAVRAVGLSFQDMERLSRVALVDNGRLPRSEWTTQDFLKFRIQGDRRLIGLAMRNCVATEGQR